MDALYNESHDPITHRVHIQISPVGGQWASDAFIQWAVEWAQVRQTRVQMHMLETPYQRIYAHRKWHKGLIEHLADISALGDWLTLAHMVWVEEMDANLLADTGTRVAHNASSNLRLRSGIAPVAQFIEAGVKVGIGMDGHTLDDDQDFLREMRLAHTLANRPLASSPNVSPKTVMQLATEIGAQVTFHDDIPLGRLAAGYLADLVLIDWSAVKGAWCPPTLPSETHLPEFFLRRANRNHVRHVMIHGEWMLKNGTHTQIDEQEIIQQVHDAYAQQTPLEPGILELYIRQHYAKWDVDHEHLTK